MTTIKTKDTLVRAGLKSGADWITFSGEFSGMDPPEFAPDSDTRVVPSQSDYENTMSTGLKRASLTLTVDLRDGMGDPGSTIPILSTWTASIVVWQIGWGALNTLSRPATPMSCLRACRWFSSSRLCRASCLRPMAAPGG